jgi:hypothetical protein
MRNEIMHHTVKHQSIHNGASRITKRVGPNILLLGHRVKTRCTLPEWATTSQWFSHSLRWHYPDQVIRVGLFASQPPFGTPDDDYPANYFTILCRFINHPISISSSLTIGILTSSITSVV